MHAKKKGSVDELAVIGIDIGKETFHLVASDRAGQLVMRRQIKRLALTATVERFSGALSVWKRVSAPISSAGRFGEWVSIRGSFRPST